MQAWDQKSCAWQKECAWLPRERPKGAALSQRQPRLPRPSGLAHARPRQQLLLAHAPQVVQQPHTQAAGALGPTRRCQLSRKAAAGGMGGRRAVGEAAARRALQGGAAAVAWHGMAWLAQVAPWSRLKHRRQGQHVPSAGIQKQHAVQKCSSAPKVGKGVGGGLQRLLREQAHKRRHQRGHCSSVRERGTGRWMEAPERGLRERCEREHRP